MKFLELFAVIFFSFFLIVILFSFTVVCRHNDNYQFPSIFPFFLDDFSLILFLILIFIFILMVSGSYQFLKCSSWVVKKKISKAFEKWKILSKCTEMTNVRLLETDIEIEKMEKGKEKEKKKEKGKVGVKDKIEFFPPL